MYVIPFQANFKRNLIILYEYLIQELIFNATKKISLEIAILCH